LYGLTEKQDAVFNKILQFLSSPTQRFFRLSGYAGVGKTYLVQILNEQLTSLSQINTAPTNKATKVLSKKIKYNQCKTIYSVLGIKMEADEDKLVLTFPNRPFNINHYDVIYIDEASMLTEALVKYIIEISNLFPRVKWIFSADFAQLNPIGEDLSMIWKLKIPSVTMTEVVRYDNEILKFATMLRDCVINYPDYHLRIKSDHHNSQGVWKKRQSDFLALALKAARLGLFHEEDDAKVVCWRNATVAYYNDLIRSEVYGRHANKERFVAGDRLFLASRLDREGQKADIDDEGTVVSAKTVHNTKYKDIKCYAVVVKLDVGKTVTLNVLHESSEDLFQSRKNELAAAAKQDKKKWGAFWALAEEFDRVRYSYSATSHRVQGSTLKTSFVDVSDVLANRNSIEALRSLYVASTRPTDSLILNY
jgi:hypothetical protein